VKRRVVVTGMAGITGLGHRADLILENMRSGNSAIRHMDDWEKYEGLHTRLGGPVSDFTVPQDYPRKKTRAMGRVAELATVATERALSSAGLLNDPVLKSGRAGVAYGSSTGSTEPALRFANLLNHQSTKGITATTYIKMMSHTSAVNIGIFFGLRGRLIPTSSACTSASHAIGYSLECIQSGKQDIMVAGGSEELCPTEAVVFDTLFATSTKNQTPQLTPSPFDKDRDGLVVGEGAGTLILEDYQHALSRGAPMFAEVLGFGTTCDAEHVTQPDPLQMQAAMEIALDDAGIHASDVGYVSCHATATQQGDIAESHATEKVFGRNTPVSSLKGHFGHSLGACGALEAWLSIEMMNRGSFAPTLNLKTPDADCASLDYIMDDFRKVETETIVSNNFGFGGLNTSLVFRRLKKEI